MLAIEAVSKVFAGRAVVDAVSLTLRPGEVVAVLGPSGSGKTSLMRLVAGFDAPTDGHIRLDEQVVSAPGRVLVPPERRRIGFAFQDATLFPHLDAVGNTAFGIRDGDRNTRRAHAREALRGMGLEVADGREVATLSGGEAQRVSLARALAAESRLLLLDEPFGNVDRLTRVDLVARLKARLAGGQAAMIVTHDPADAFDLAARVLLMREGRLVADAEPAAIAAGACGDWARSLLRS